jgi:signal transduction histidine kinase
MQTTERMMQIINNLLDGNAIELGVFNFTIEKCDLTVFVEQIVADYAERAAIKRIQVQYTPPPDSTITALGDRSALKSVLDNILSNAVKYSPHGKNVFVRVLTSVETATARVEVQDEGPGISEQDMAKLFGKFARLTARPTGGEHSTGLGLSIVKKMVEAMNGRVWCESEVGQGATFIVELPASP